MTSGARGLTALVALVLTSCGVQVESSTSTADFTTADAVECRELGGGWVHIRYARGDATLRQTRLGLPTSDGLTDEPDVSDDELEAAIAERDANGWGEAALNQLTEQRVPPGVDARLSQEPSCLDDLRG